MFFLLLSLLHEEYSSGRMDFETYEQNIFLLAEDFQNLRSALSSPSKAA